MDLAAALTELSSTVCQLRGLRQLHGGDVELDGLLGRTVADLESLITRLLHTDGNGARLDPRSSASSSMPHQRAFEEAFIVWLSEPRSADELSVTRDGEPEPLGRLLGGFTLSRRVLPTEAATGIGLPDGSTVGDAATELLLAVKDPAGPRCRSYRAAVYYLRDLDRGRFVGPDAGKYR